ncbi:DNA repair protein RadA [Thermotoga petrophila RKU-10]|uniref:DNA repair protein RadA n=1 Tax=Thermotoga petrophila (strain ATCC BAA-489 / DSM 13996 / JCM 10882 / RKU-10) TaxID=590168 RepID=D2C7I5_THEP2|nr:DNA repair protein RadA [Thermotoga petrophila]ADA66921.1 DNA repair protein RadA [Thermotoga petrophila RKU-10]
MKKFICSNCGYVSPKWFGKCPQCGEYDTAEEVIQKRKNREGNPSLFLNLEDAGEISLERLSTGFSELDRAFRGGIVPGQVILLSGEPGIGKSTIALQIAEKFAERGLVVYVSGEESPQQLKLRADRLLMKRKKNILLTLENDIDEIISSLRNERVSFMVVDSIQTVFSSDLGSSPGSISQVKNVTMKTIDFAKKRGVPVLLVGHVTKEGEIAGPKLVEHMVDTVAYFEGDRRTGLRLLKITKNRFGPSDEVAVFELKENGFVQVENPSFTEGDTDLPGNVLTCVFEGTKPFVVQIQALVSKNRTFSPKRVCKGVDVNRVMLLIAVISKYLRLPIETHDVYVNVVGGLRITDPAADLAIALSIVSSYLEVSLHDTAAVGEIGLDGRVRKVYNINRRLNSLKNSGRIIVPPIEEEKKGVFVVRDLKEAVFIIGGEILGSPGID